MGGKSLILVICAVSTLVALSSSGSAYSFYATTNKLVYTAGENIIITGNITNTLNPVNMTAAISNATPISFYNLSSNSTGSNIFTLSQPLSGLEGTYTANISDSSVTIPMSFEVVSTITYLETRLINTQDIKSVDTSATIAADDAMGGNFSEPRASSISGTLHYGNASMDGMTYHFVLMDQNYNQTYDTLYIDDDISFLIDTDNGTEDSGNMVERILQKGQKFGDYMIGEIDYNTGNRVVLGKPKGSSVYSAGSAVSFIVMAKDSDKNLAAGVTVHARLMNSSKGVISSLTNTTNSMGFFTASFTAPSVAGSYTIDLNNSKGTGFFTVESFKLTGKATDLSDNPASSFAPNSIVRIYASSGDADGNAVNLTSGSVKITYPNGTSVTAGMTQSDTGSYYHDFSLGSINGNYGVKITGAYGGSSQEFITGFSVESASLELMAMNMDFIDQAEGQGAQVNAFAPQGNITLMVFLSNISAGGMMAQGPEGAGMIDIDNSSTPDDECGSVVSFVEFRDDRGIGLDIPVHYSVNISRAISMSNVTMSEEEGPPQEILRQCVIIFAAPNRTGTYKAVAEVSHNGERKKAGASFSVQRLYAEGASVDSKGDDYWFFAPNTTMKIKLKIRDLATRQDLPPQNITGAKIIEIYKQFPDYQDVFTSEFRTSVNESIQNGTLIFNSPDAEGFFFMRFKFKAFVNGTEETGTGSAFFQLKKYMIWATPQCSQSFGPCISGAGKNITLIVNVVDIDQGSMMSQMGKGTDSLTCTDCDGLVVNVSSLRNDQIMKDMTYGIDYYVESTPVANATANLTIVPLSSRMQSGWYGMDLLARDPVNANNSYFGWGGFEIRNLYVEAMKITDNGTALLGSWDMSSVFEKGGTVLFAVSARDPSTGDMLQMSSVSLESVKWLVGWPPVEIPVDSLSISAGTAPVYTEWNPGPVNMTVINITGLDKDGDIQANVRVSTSKGSDIGSFFFSLSTYNIEVSYRKGDNWMPAFSSSENLTVNFTGLDFETNPHNLSEAGTKLKSVFNQKTGNPLRLASATNCSGNMCTVTANLSSLQSGWYSAEYSVNDSQGYEKAERLEFMVQNTLVGIPSVEEGWVGYSETSSKDVEVNNDRDRCSNQMTFPGNWVQGEWNIRVFCIRASGEWMSEGCGTDDGENITVSSNGTMLSISGENISAGGNFSAAGNNWTVVSIGDPQNNSFHINNTDGVCGESWINCGDQGCQQSGYIMRPPSSHTSFYHGFLENLVGDRGGEFTPLSGNQTRSLYFYHNTTHAWISNSSSNMSLLGPARTVGDTFSDPYGGQWKVSSISKSRVKITGMNVLPQTGAYINVSKSKSGVIKLGRIEERWLGGWDRSTGQSRGLDLDGDGYTNSSVYIAIADSAVAGIYDTFFFFNHTGTSNFSTEISVNDPNISARRFGLNDTVILLSIDPRADRARFYSEKIGDWASLGDFRMDGNISIPVIVRTPAGAPAEANVSIPNIRVKGAGMNIIKGLGSSVPNATINGTGEVRIANISQYSLGSGEYVFEVRVAQGSSQEILEEWKWPRANPRTFLVNGYTGQAGYVSGFKPLPISRYDWESYGEPMQLYTVNWTNMSKFFKGVLDLAGAGGGNMANLTECNFVEPSAAGSNETNATLRSSRLTNPQYYYYITASNASRVWIKTGDCNFTTNTTEYDASTAPAINVTKNTRKYMVRVLDAEAYTYSVVIGINSQDFNDQISPVKVETWGPPGEETESPVWFIMGLNISGTDYNVILANDTMEYPMCSVWNIQECIKRAWFSTSANFSQAVPAYAGENFTSQLYAAKVGPAPWEGIIIANFSSLGSLPRPAVDIRARDSTTSYFNLLDENALSLDLNMDGDKGDQFYAVTFDDFDDGQQVLNQIIVDDDLNITEEWWSSSNTNQSAVYKKDFYGNEAGSLGEKRSSLPSSIWSGNIWFGDQTEGLRWEYQPQWNIEKYNGTDMLLLKDEWEINGTRNISILLRAYNFDQSPIQGANVSVPAIKGNMPGFGFMKLEQGTHYNLPANVTQTDQNGYAIIIIIPQGSWSGEYMADIQTAYGGNTETTGMWFKVM